MADSVVNLPTAMAALRLAVAEGIVDEMAETDLVALERAIRRSREKQRKCRLLALPPELRSCIYQYVGLNSMERHVRYREAPAMLAVSRKIRNEFEPLYYAMMELEKMETIQKPKIEYEAVKSKRSYDMIEISRSPGIYRWTPMPEWALKKQLLAPRHGRTPQTLEFCHCFGESGEDVTYDEQWSHYPSVERPPPGDKECARRMLQEDTILSRGKDEWGQGGYAFKGILVFPAASRVTPQRVVQSENIDMGF